MSYDIGAVIDAGGPEPVSLGIDWNYTSNVACMWRKAMPDTDGLAGLEGMLCGDAAKAIREGLVRMAAEPDAYRAMNPPNGWGDFDSQYERLAVLAAAFEGVPKATPPTSSR